jgi:hypothetical protein
VTQEVPDLALFHPAAELNRTLLVRGAATLDLHGAPRASTWKPLARRADARDPSVRVWRGDHWQAGDRVVLASTDFDMFQAEVRTILQAQPVGFLPYHELLLDAPLDHGHWMGRVGSAETPWVFENGEVGLLSHNVKVTSSDRAQVPGVPCPDLAYTGAEIRILRQGGASPTVRLEHVEIENAGKFDQLGHYPVHFHMLGPVPGSYVRGISVHGSGNKAVVLHGTEQVLVEDNVAYDVIGHAFYLEPMACGGGDLECFDTARNTLRHNLGVQVRGCGTLDLEDKDDADPANDFFESSVFYFEDPRNVFLDNAAAGAIFAGFYYGNDRRMGLDGWHLCGDTAIDYAATDHVLLDEAEFLYDNASYTTAEYDARGYRDAGAVRCHGSFFQNTAHSSFFGFWSEEHKDSLIRLTDFTAYKNSDRAVLLKNHGLSEVVRLRAADNATALWPASHAYHIGYSPRFLLIDSHLIGESANLGEIDSADETVAQRSLPAGIDPFGDGGVPFYGVEVYEGRFHAADTHFEKFEPLAALPGRPSAAFGRHQSFPFYTNNPDNSARGVSFGALTNRVWFDDPATHASGEATVILHDLDGNVSGTAGASIVPRHDFIVPGQLAALGAAATFDPAWNAHVVDPSEKYGQLIVEWCDSGPAQFCDSHDGPSSEWRSQATGVGVYGAILGLEIKDVTDCAAAGAGCPDVLEAEHSNDGTHDKLGGNVLSGHTYRVGFWRDRNGTPLATSALAVIEAMQVHLRYAPAGSLVRVTLPLDRAPRAVFLYRGEANPARTDTISVAAPPAAATEWYYDAAARRVYLYLDTAVEGENASVLLLLP